MDTPEPLWRDLVGDPEPWRRGRLYLVVFAVVSLVGHVLGLLALLLTAYVELALWAAFMVLVWWSFFAFVWLGVHWVRFLLGGYSMLVGFAQVIWAWRDDLAVYGLTGCVNLILGALLFAPAIYHFAERQRERISSTERLVVLAGLGVIVAILFYGLTALKLFRRNQEREFERFATKSLEKIYLERDTSYLFAYSSRALMERYGQIGLSRFMMHKYGLSGELSDFRLAPTKMVARYGFPLTLVNAGVAGAEAESRCGRMLMRLEFIEEADGWRIDAFWWVCPDARRRR